MKNYSSFQQYPSSRSNRVDILALFEDYFGSNGRTVWEISDLHFDFTIEDDGLSLDAKLTELKNYLLWFPIPARTTVFDEFIREIGIGIARRPDSASALAFAKTYQIKRTWITFLEALYQHGNFNEAKTLETILASTPGKKPANYSMRLWLRKIIGCFSYAKGYDGELRTSIKDDLLSATKRILDSESILAYDPTIKRDIAMILAEHLGNSMTCSMSAKAFDILVNDFQEIPDFDRKDERGYSVFDYAKASVDSIASENAVKFLRALRSSLLIYKADAPVYFPTEDKELEEVRRNNHPVAVRIRDAFNMITGEDMDDIEAAEALKPLPIPGYSDPFASDKLRGNHINDSV